MSSADRFKSSAPDVQAVVRLEIALPPEHPVHVFVERRRAVGGCSNEESSARKRSSAWSSFAKGLARQKSRLAKIQAAREHLEAEQRADREQRSFANTDSRIMLMKRDACDYISNAQSAHDAGSGVIVAAALTNVAAALDHLPSLVAEVRPLRDGVGVLGDHPTTDGLGLLIAAAGSIASLACDWNPDGGRGGPVGTWLLGG
jgi:hypothetical protein